jgi:hypothetical protein
MLCTEILLSIRAVALKQTSTRALYTITPMPLITLLLSYHTELYQLRIVCCTLLTARFCSIVLATMPVRPSTSSRCSDGASGPAALKASRLLPLVDRHTVSLLSSVQPLSTVLSLSFVMKSSPEACCVTVTAAAVNTRIRCVSRWHSA